MQMVKWFLERGWPQKGLGLQTQRELMSYAAGETQSSESFWVECSVSRATTLSYKHLASCVFSSSGLAASHLFCTLFSSLFVSVTYFWFTGRHPYCHQTGGRALDWSQARGESWNLPSAVYRGEVFSVLPSCHCLNVGCGLFSVIKVDTCRLALWSDGAALAMNWSVDVVAGCH